jgi:hypothetical protein
LFGCSVVRLFGCSVVRLFGCSVVRLFGCSVVVVVVVVGLLKAPATEGYVNLKRNATANWERVWVSCAGQTLLYYKNNMAQKAIDKLTAKDVKLVVADSPTDFRIELVTDAPGAGWIHRANGGEDRDRWMTRLEFMKKQTVDVFDFLRIQDSEVESAVSEERLEVWHHTSTMLLVSALRC